MNKNKYGVHRTHCCIEHGCKYGDKDCPVVSGEIRQDYICEDCSYDGIKSVDELFNRTTIDQTINNLFSLIEGWEGSAFCLKEDEDYLNYKTKILDYIKGNQR